MDSINFLCDALAKMQLEPVEGFELNCPDDPQQRIAAVGLATFAVGGLLFAGARRVLAGSGTTPPPSTHTTSAGGDGAAAAAAEPEPEPESRPETKGKTVDATPPTLPESESDDDSASGSEEDADSSAGGHSLEASTWLTVPGADEDGASDEDAVDEQLSAEAEHEAAALLEDLRLLVMLESDLRHLQDEQAAVQKRMDDCSDRESDFRQGASHASEHAEHMRQTGDDQWEDTAARDNFSDRGPDAYAEHAEESAEALAELKAEAASLQRQVEPIEARLATPEAQVMVEEHSDAEAAIPPKDLDELVTLREDITLRQMDLAGLFQDLAYKFASESAFRVLPLDVLEDRYNAYADSSEDAADDLAALVDSAAKHAAELHQQVVAIEARLSTPEALVLEQQEQELRQRLAAEEWDKRRSLEWRKNPIKYVAYLLSRLSFWWRSRQ